MDRSFQDLTGERFGRLIAIKRLGEEYRENRGRWICICDCGNPTSTKTHSLTSGATKSCGCLGDEVRADNRNKHRTHGLRKTPEYNIWNLMRNRCLNPNATSYKHYGGRGISLCERWLKFENFYADMGPRPLGLTLDRINVDGDYEPGNCRWATWIEQCRNKRKRKPKTHCIRGHELKGENLYLPPCGQRHCRACMKIRNDNRYKNGE